MGKNTMDQIKNENLTTAVGQLAFIATETTTENLTSNNTLRFKVLTFGLLIFFLLHSQIFNFIQPVLPERHQRALNPMRFILYGGLFIQRRSHEV